MSNNRIKSCECFRFPSGTAMCASERIRQKANIQIYKNNVLLNCKDQNSRVYSGTHNRLRSINGFKLHEESKANSDCGGNPDCIFSDKKAADYWIVGKPSAAALCPNRETITLEQALAQGGVRDCQDLVITQPSSTSIENSDGIVEYIAGLVIETGNTFTIAKTGKVTIATDIAATGDERAVGILVKSNGKLINNGTITFEGAISGDAAFGIFNGGSFEQSGGTITFKDAISGQGGDISAVGIVNTGSFEQSGGTITFESAISSSGQFATVSGIFNSGSFEQSGGTITFEDTISSSGGAAGILNLQNGSFETNGTITFEGTISGEQAAYGIAVAPEGGITGGKFQTNGAIRFEGDISGQGSAFGILNVESFEQSGGAIKFEGAISGQNQAGGILNQGSGSFKQSSGAIIFEGTISGQTQVYGILNVESFEQSGGAIKFEGDISVDSGTDKSRAFGISNSGTSFETNGAITFVNETLDFIPEDASTNITGTGTITYGTNPVNTYYP